MPRSGLLPAQPRLAAVSPRVTVSDHRLIVLFQRAVLVRLAQVEFETAAQLGAALHLRFEEVVAAAAFRLGAVEAEISDCATTLVRRAVAWRHHDPDAHAADQFIVLNLITLRQCLHQFAGDPATTSGPDTSDRITANSSPPSRATISGTQALAQPVRHHLEQLIADRMTKTVIDELDSGQRSVAQAPPPRLPSRNPRESPQRS